jgi:hypothetical protein
MTQATASRAAVLSPGMTTGLRWLDYVIAAQIFMWTFLATLFVLRPERGDVGRRLVEGYALSPTVLAAAAAPIETATGDDLPR